MQRRYGQYPRSTEWELYTHSSIKWTRVADSENEGHPHMKFNDPVPRCCDTICGDIQSECKNPRAKPSQDRANRGKPNPMKIDSNPVRQFPPPYQPCPYPRPTASPKFSGL